MARPVFFIAPKQPADITHIPGIDFEPRLTLPDEVIESFSHIDITIADRDDGTDTTDAMLVPDSIGLSDSVVAFQVAGGSDNHDYVATIRVSTSRARIEEGDVIIPVRARPR